MTCEQAKAAALEVEVAKRDTFHGIIHTSGRIISATCDEVTVVATISGRVHHSIHLSEGMAVNNGQTLFNITSADMHQAEGDPVQHARIELERAEREYQRGQTLVAERIISEREFQALSTAYQAARLSYTALQRQRSAAGYTITAPRGGYLKQCLADEGVYVEAGQPLAVITQNQHLYLRAEVPERRFGELHQIQGAKFRTSYSERVFDVTEMGGHVQSYGRSAEVNNSYIPITFEFNNTGEVVQGSYAEIYLITAARPDVISLPLSAITEEQGLHYIYIRRGHEDFRKQEVTLGQDDGERVEVLSGLRGGEKVVTRGAMQVKLASATNAIPEHHHH